MVSEQDKRVEAPKSAAKVMPIHAYKGLRRQGRPRNLSEAMRMEAKAESRFFEEFKMSRGEANQALNSSDKIFLGTIFGITSALGALIIWMMFT